MSDSNEETRRENEAAAEDYRLHRVAKALLRLSKNYEYLRHHAPSDEERKDIACDAKAVIRALVEDWV